MSTENPFDANAKREQFSRVCERASLRVEELAPEVTRRMLLLAEYTATFDDCTRAMNMAERVFQHCDQLGMPFTLCDKNEVRIGSLFSDIGKTGPLRANQEQQRLIARMFAVEGVRNDKMTVTEFFSMYFAAESDHAAQLFAALGLDLTLSLRQFWNLHSEWTFELLQDSGVPREGVAAAAAHHILEHVNPYSMVADDGTFTHSFGSNIAFDRPEKLVILLDKYDALRRRGRRDHTASIVWLRQLLTTHTRFGDDRQFQSLLDVMDTVFRDDALWAAT